MFFTAVKHRNFLRGLALLLLAAAIFGPWGYTSDGVPPPEWCSEPNFLQESRGEPPFRCVRFLPGTELFLVWRTVLAYLPMLLFSGQYTILEIGRELIFFLFGLILFILPFASTLIVLASGEKRAARIFSIVSWILALTLLVLIALTTVFEQMPGAAQLWGVWLYAVVAVCALLLEWFAAKDQRRAGNQNDGQPFQPDQHPQSST